MPKSKQAAIETEKAGEIPLYATTPARKPGGKKIANIEQEVKSQPRSEPQAPSLKIGLARAEQHLAEEVPAQVLSSETVYDGPLFRVLKEQVREPNGHTSTRDIIRHNGSVVILPVDTGNKKSKKKDPLIILERQYRHAAGQYLWEIPAGKIELGEERLAGAKRELAEETGYEAKKWTELVRYFASPGFLGEWMQVYLAEELTPGNAAPEADETLDIFGLTLSEVESLIEQGMILDGKTLIAISMYKRLRRERKKAKK